MLKMIVMQNERWASQGRPNEIYLWRSFLQSKLCYQYWRLYITHFSRQQSRMSIGEWRGSGNLRDRWMCREIKASRIECAPGLNSKRKDLIWWCIEKTGSCYVQQYLSYKSGLLYNEFWSLYQMYSNYSKKRYPTNFFSLSVFFHLFL